MFHLPSDARNHSPSPIPTHCHYKLILLLTTICPQPFGHDSALKQSPVLSFEVALQRNVESMIMILLEAITFYPPHSTLGNNLSSSCDPTTFSGIFCLLLFGIYFVYSYKNTAVIKYTQWNVVTSKALCVGNVFVWAD